MTDQVEPTRSKLPPPYPKVPFHPVLKFLEVQETIKRVQDVQQIVKHLHAAQLKRAYNPLTSAIYTVLEAKLSSDELSFADLDQLQREVLVAGPYATILRASGKMSDADFREILGRFRTLLKKLEQNVDEALVTQKGQKNPTQATESAIKKLTHLKEQMTKASGSLANDFANTILGKFMPHQEKYLMEIAQLLAFFNFGATSGNLFLNIISGWGTVDNDFSFGNWAASNQGGSYEEASGKLNQEKANTDKYLSQAEKLKKAIEGRLKKLDQMYKDGKISKKQYEKMKGQLSGDLKGVTKTIGDLKALKKELAKVHIVQNGNTFKIEPPGVMDKVSSLENAVHTDASALFSDINNQLGGWQSQSETTKLQLEMHMTEIQQEWTIVSTCLKTLFQSFQVFAQAIYH